VHEGPVRQPVCRMELKVISRLVLRLVVWPAGSRPVGLHRSCLPPALARRPDTRLAPEMLVVLAQSSRQDRRPPYPTLARSQRLPKPWPTPDKPLEGTIRFGKLAPHTADPAQTGLRVIARTSSAASSCSSVRLPLAT